MADERTIEITAADLETMLDEAAERGARQALRLLGLNDDAAQSDLRDLRGLLTSWREVRKGILQAVIKILTTAILGALLLGMGIKMGAVGTVQPTDVLPK